MSCHSMVNSPTKSKGWLWVPMAVSYANIIISEFEQRLLQDYEQRCKHKPAIWLRFIVTFLVWIGDEASLISFLKYCNEYSKNRGMLSNIKFP